MYCKQNFRKILYIYISNNIVDFYTNKTEILDSLFSVEDNICLDFSRNKKEIEEIAMKILDLSEDDSILDSENKVTKQFKEQMPKLNNFFSRRAEVSKNLKEKFDTPEIDTPVEIRTLRDLLHRDNASNDYTNNKKSVFRVLEYVVEKKYPTSYKKYSTFIVATDDFIILQNQGDEKEFPKFTFYQLVIQIAVRYRDEELINKIVTVDKTDFYIIKDVLKYLIVFEIFRNEMKDFIQKSENNVILFFNTFISITDIIEAFSKVRVSEGVNPDEFLKQKLRGVYSEFPDWFRGMEIEKINDYKILHQVLGEDLTEDLYEFKITNRNTYNWQYIEGMSEAEISSFIKALSRKKAYINYIFLEWISNKYSLEVNNQILNYFLEILEYNDRKFIFTDDSIHLFLEKIENSKVSRDMINKFIPFVKYDKFQRMVMDTNFMKNK